jgi:hypothetical protein
MSKNEQVWAELLAVPGDFFHGLLGGLLGPILALTGGVGLIYLLTGQLPAVKEVTGSDGSRSKAIVLTSQAEARASWARLRGELRGAALDLKARKEAKS